MENSSKTVINETNSVLEKIETSSLSAASNEENVQTLKSVAKVTDEESKYINKIYDDIKKIKQRKYEIFFYAVSNDMANQKFIEDVIFYHNQAMNYISHFKGINVWRSNTGKEIYYRINPYGTKNKIISNDDLLNLFNARVKIYDEINDVIISDNSLIFVKSLLLRQTDVFTPNINMEFYIFNDINYRNTFQPTYFLRHRDNQLQHANQNNTFANPKPDSFITTFIRHLSKNEYQYQSIMQWLAYFFQKMNNAKISIVLIGNYTTTEILVNEILKPIFATKDEYFSVINDETLKKTKDSLLKDKIFYHFDNLSTISANVEKTRELLFEILNYKSQNTYMYGGILITSSKDTPYPYLKDCISACSVLNVGHIDTILKKMNVDRIQLCQSIQNDLDNFSYILSIYPLKPAYDELKNNANIDAMISMKNGLFRTKELDTQIEQFIHAIKTKNLHYFKNIENTNKEMYEEFEHNINEDMIAQPLLGEYFNLIVEDKIFSDNNSLLEILKEKDEIFRQSPADISKYLQKKRYKISNP